MGLQEWRIKNGTRKSFEQNQEDDTKNLNKMDKLRADRRSPKQLRFRMNMLIELLKRENIEYESALDFEIVFSSVKEAKDAFKIVKKSMDNNRNKQKMMNLSKIDYIDGELKKNMIYVK